MNTIDNRILSLDKVSQARITSSVQILSLNDVVVELVKNALDAQARKIEVVLNYGNGFCSVLDDGEGIPAKEFGVDGRLAQADCTSKAGRSDKLYGRNGRYLAALSGVSLLSIASRSDDRHVYVLWLDESGRLTVSKEPPDALEVKSGTRVRVYSLFSKLPVRSKYLADHFTSNIELYKEFDQLKHTLTGLVLAHPRCFEIDVRHSSSACKFHHKPVASQDRARVETTTMRSIATVVSALCHAGFIEQPQITGWREATIDSGGTKLHAAISLEPVPHKLVQFISINHEPLSRSKQPQLFQTVNSLFDESNFGALDEPLFLISQSDGTSETCADEIHRPRKDHSKSVDRWPMFVVWISTTLDVPEESFCATGINDRAQELISRIDTLLKSLITEFLVSQHFQNPRINPESLSSRYRSKHDKYSSSEVETVKLSSSKQNFRHWSRVKSSRGMAMDDILTGLPFQPSKHQEHSTPVQIDSMLPVPQSPTVTSTVSADRFESGRTESEAPPNLSQTNPFAGGFHEWPDPQTGRTLQIDIRTGMIIPRKASFTDATLEGTLGPSRVSKCPVPQARRNKQQARPLVQIARNVQRYSSGWFRGQDRAIRSLSLFDGINESFEEVARTRAKHLDILCRSAGHRNGSIECLELPPISKKALEHARILRQVDNKFILAVVPNALNTTHWVRPSGGQLVLIDQHAADERCKVEDLLYSVQNGDAVLLASPLTFEVSSAELRSLVQLKPYFAQWQIVYDVSEGFSADINSCVAGATQIVYQVHVSSLPSAVAERCRAAPKLVVEILREVIWSDERYRPVTSQRKPFVHSQGQDQMAKTINGLDVSPVTSTISIPPRLLDLIHSRACRSAIMFNDVLTIDQCERLVRQLGTSTLPFQCAHGRPSMVVLSDMRDFDDNEPLIREACTSALLSNGSHSGHDPGQGQASTLALQAGRFELNSVNTMTFGQAYHAWTTSGSRTTGGLSCLPTSASLRT